MGFGVIDVAKVGSEKIYQLDSIANNLANSSTSGFKMENFYPGAPTAADAKEGPVPVASRAIVDYSQGMLKETGNVLDLAIEGGGFFKIQTKAGTEYTRKGSFTLDSQSRMATLAGGLVMGDKGPITVSAKDFSIDPAGNVMVNGAPADRLSIVSFDNPKALARTKEGMFRDEGTAGAKRVANPDIKSHMLEMSNVNVFKEMVGMIDVQRAFESYQKIIQTITDMDKLAVSRIGRLA
ncbi:MAG: flagellar hook-basal body protein [Syntrophales bacterium]